jgi:hypothetical protein
MIVQKAQASGIQISDTLLNKQTSKLTERDYFNRIQKRIHEKRQGKQDLDQMNENQSAKQSRNTQI